MSVYQEEITRHTKGKTHNLKRQSKHQNQGYWNDQNSMQKQMGNVSREMKILRKNQKKC